MSAIGAKYRWFEGKILHAARLWKAPSKRRIPRILIEDRAKEVGIRLSIKEPWFIFEETKEPAEAISMENAEELVYYRQRFYLLPATFKRQDTYDWLNKEGNALLLWSKDNKYYIKQLA